MAMNSAMSKTPTTDKNCWRENNHPNSECVSANLARKFEIALRVIRELNYVEGNESWNDKVEKHIKEALLE
jgi:hypothetical protein